MVMFVTGRVALEHSRDDLSRLPHPVACPGNPYAEEVKRLYKVEGFWQKGEGAAKESGASAPASNNLKRLPQVEKISMTLRIYLPKHCFLPGC